MGQRYPNSNVTANVTAIFLCAARYNRREKLLAKKAKRVRGGDGDGDGGGDGVGGDSVGVVGGVVLMVMVMVLV